MRPRYSVSVIPPSRLPVRWPGDIREAREEQEQLRSRVRIVPFSGMPPFVAGVDAAFSDATVFAAACLYRLPELDCMEQASAVLPLRFPYVPGYLSFREGPAIIAALERLNQRPDLLLLDGQGIAHPRGIGIASHLGVLLRIPTIGCAKTRLVGEHREPGKGKGAWAELRYEGRTVGAALRTRDAVRPVYVSPGHLIDLEDSIRVVLGCTGRYRLPEPLRSADRLSRERRRGG